MVVGVTRTGLLGVTRRFGSRSGKFSSPLRVESCPPSPLTLPARIADPLTVPPRMLLNDACEKVNVMLDCGAGAASAAAGRAAPHIATTARIGATSRQL